MLLAASLLLSLGPGTTTAGEPESTKATPRPAAKSPGTAAAAAKGPADPLAVVQERARQAGKTLVLEFGAAWCAPCTEFERLVLPTPTVQRQLKRVVFVRYDAEEPTGKATAHSLGVVGYPTFIALRQDGEEIARLHGFQDAPDFASWVSEVAPDSDPTDALVARVAAQPGEAEGLLLLGQRRLRQGDEAQALALFERSVSAASLKGNTGEVAARADWSLRLLRLRQVLRNAPRQAMTEHLQRFPTGPAADEAFKALARLGPADENARKALGRYVDAHRDVSQIRVLNQAVYECLRAGALDEAERGARRLLEIDAKSPIYHDTMAEVLHLRGDRAGALKHSDLALGILANKSDNQTKLLRAAVLANKARFERGLRELPEEIKGEADELFPWERAELSTKPPAAPPSGK